MWLVWNEPPGSRVDPAEDDRRDRLKQITTVLIAAVAADFDFLPGFLVGDPAAYHRGPSQA